MEFDIYSNWIEIDLEAIRHNIKELQYITKQPVMAVVKANAYGHGLIEVSQAAEAAGATWCGVARLEEAVVLRHAGIRCRILVLGFTPPRRIMEALEEDISLTIYDPEVAHAYAALAQESKTRLRVHVKFDTGMGRLGMYPEEGVEFLQWLYAQPGLELEGIFTHLARADEPDEPTTDQQIDRFQRLIEGLRAYGLRPPWVHAANSAAALYFPKARYGLVRPGIAVYGLHPSEKATLPLRFHPALSWKTRLISVKTLPQGHGVSYGHRYYTSQSERIGVIAAGYADGLRRISNNFALIHAKRVPIVGTVCMDQCMLQLDEVPEAAVGDEVVLIGKQDDVSITAEEVAKLWGTINYEVVCGLAKRLPRIYLNK